MELGKQSTQSANDIVTAFKLVGSAKPELLENREALANVTKEVIVLAEASGLDLTQATRVAVTALNQYGAGADQASRFVNALVSQDIAQSKGGVIILLKTRKTIRLSRMPYKGVSTRIKLLFVFVGFKKLLESMLVIKW